MTTNLKDQYILIYRHDCLSKELSGLKQGTNKYAKYMRKLQDLLILRIMSKNNLRPKTKKELYSYE